MEMKPAFAAKHISQSYGKRDILRDVSLEAAAGECVGIAGRNGCGKSTLLSILAGVKKPHTGELFCCGYQLLPKKDAKALKERRTFGSLIGYVPQTNPLLGDLTARDNLRLWAGRSFDEAHPAVQALALGGFLGQKTGKLSGGMARRLAIACALINDPPVLVLDEPASALDLYHRDAIYSYLKEYTEKGGIILLTTHDPEEMRFCSRLYLLRDGQVSACSAGEAEAAIRKTV